MFLFGLPAEPASQSPSPRRDIEGYESDADRYHPKSNERQKAENPQNQRHHSDHRSDTPGQMLSAPIRRSAQDLNGTRFDLDEKSTGDRLS
jgi:hypothetical protein